MRKLPLSDSGKVFSMRSAIFDGDDSFGVAAQGDGPVLGGIEGFEENGLGGDVGLRCREFLDLDLAELDDRPVVEQLQGDVTFRRVVKRSERGRFEAAGHDTGRDIALDRQVFALHDDLVGQPHVFWNGVDRGSSRICS